MSDITKHINKCVLYNDCDIDFNNPDEIQILEHWLRNNPNVNFTKEAFDKHVLKFLQGIDKKELAKYNRVLVSIKIELGNI